MEKNRKWGYIFDEKLNMYIPDLPRQRKIAKVLLVLSAISFIAALVQGFFLDKTSFEQISFLSYSIVAIFLFLSLYAVIKINIHLIEKRLKLIEEVEEINLSEKRKIAEENILKLRQARLDELSKHSTDIVQLQKIIHEQSKLKKEGISID